MSKNTPDVQDILDFIIENPAPVTKRELASSFGIKGQEPRRWLKQVLKDLVKEGKIDRTRSKAYKAPEGLPGVGIVEVVDISPDGELIAEPTEFTGKGRTPRVYVVAKGKNQIGVGERALVRLKRIEKKDYEGRIIHVLGGEKGTIVGIFRSEKNGGGRIFPADRSIKYDFYVKPEDVNGATDEFLVVGEIQDSRNRADKNKKSARVVEVLGHEDDPKMISMIAVVTHGIPHIFPQEVIDQAEKGTVPDLGKRQDLRTVPLVTIDGADARDFDDAVFAEPDPDPENQGGFHLIVAIADVSYYVTPGSPLDQEAYKRGNSTYFPDRVVPMLPEALSNDICSLRPHEPRACLATHMWIDKDGNLKRYKFVRGLMQSHARLIYEQVQNAYDGHGDETTEGVMIQIENLYDAYKVLSAARKKRGALDLDLPERAAVIDRETGEIKDIIPRNRVDAHMLIEEFMVLANVAAASALEDKKAPCIYRVHERPDAKKIDMASDFLSTLGINFDKGQKVTPKRMNDILERTRETDESELVSMMVLRSQAVYSPDNAGHFGLALDRYAHFTSPIRRYADLIVHRSMVAAYNLPGKGDLPQEDHGILEQMAEHISDTERRSMTAERDSMDRYTTLYLQDRVGNEFDGKISGVTTAGLFIRLNETGADGLIPIRTLSKDYYVHHEDKHALIGRHTGQTYRLGMPVKVRLVQADPLLGRMTFELMEYFGTPLPDAAMPAKKGRKKNDSRKNFKKGRQNFSGKKGTKAPVKRKNNQKKKKKTTPKHKRKSKT